MSDSVKVRLLFVDDGEFHHESVEIPAGASDEYDRLIDYLREDVAVQKKLYLDVSRLVSAYVAD